MTHPETQELLAAFALSALEPDEEREVEAHLEECDECRRELAQLLEAGAVLAAGLPDATPPPELREAVLASVRRAPPDRRPAEAGLALAALGALAVAAVLLVERLYQFAPQEWSPTARLLALLFGAAVLGIVLALATRLFQLATASQAPAGPAPPARPEPLWLAVGTVLVVLLGAQVLLAQRQNAALSDRLASQSRLFALLTSGSSVTVRLAGSASGSVRLVFDPKSREGVLVSDGIAPPKPGSVYQVWLLGGPTPESEAVFTVGSNGTSITVIGADFARYRAIAVTVEPGPRGSPQPTAAPVWTGALSAGKA